MKAASEGSQSLSLLAKSFRSLIWGLYEYRDFFCLWRLSTVGLGRVGFTQVDLGLARKWVLEDGSLAVVSWRIVVEIGLS